MEVRSRTLEWLRAPSLKADQLLVPRLFWPLSPCSAVCLSPPSCQEPALPPTENTMSLSPCEQVICPLLDFIFFSEPFSVPSNEHILPLRSFLDDLALLGLDPSPRPPTRGHFLPLRTQPPPPLPCCVQPSPGWVQVWVLPSSWTGVETLRKILRVCHYLPAPTLRGAEVCEWPGASFHWVLLSGPALCKDFRIKGVDRPSTPSLWAQWSREE